MSETRVERFDREIDLAELRAAMLTGLGDTIYVWSSWSTPFALGASGVASDILAGGGEVSPDFPENDSLEWDAVENELVVKQAGLYDGYHGFSWNEAADSSPSTRFPFLRSSDGLIIITAIHSGVLPGDVGLYGRFSGPTWIPANTRFTLMASRIGSDVVTVNYAELKVVRIG